LLKLGNGNLIKPKIIVARHGETSMNYRGELQGRSDGEGAKLNLKGIQQAGNLAVFCASHFINQIICSPLGRAVETAQIVGNQIGIEPTTDDRLIEMDFGDLEGRLKKEMQMQLPDLSSVCLDYRYPNGESYAELYQRVKDFAEDYDFENLEGRVLLVAHSHTNRILRAPLLGKNPADYLTKKQSNNEVVIINPKEKSERKISLDQN
jgi:probable phosphoglycerate mutase